MDEKGLQGLVEGNEPDRESVARRVAREEVASLCGLMLRRLQSGEAAAVAVTAEELESRLLAAFGEALRDFGGESAPGPEYRPAEHRHPEGDE